MLNTGRVQWQGDEEEQVMRVLDLTCTEPAGRESRQDASDVASLGFPRALINLCAS